MRATHLLKTALPSNHVIGSVNHYTDNFNHRQIDVTERIKDVARLSEEYYTLATDFYLHGWGRLFHFGVRRNGESLKRSLVRHEMFLAEKLKLHADETCLDLGCGVGGPMINMANATGANITGINNCAYQIEKAQGFISEAGLSEQCNFANCDWMHMPFDDAHFDKAYAIEATCHAADKREDLFKEVHRVLKPGALFGGYEWVLTDKYDETNAAHVEAKEQIEVGDGISQLTKMIDVVKALHNAGFDIVECRDVAPYCDDETPWYLPLKGKTFSLAHLRTSPAGRFLMRNTLQVLEALHTVPKGSTDVHKVLETAADGLVKAGELGIFTPMLFFLARKK